MLRFETAGESHGECLVATLAGLPAGIPISLKAVNHELWRRQQGYGRGGRMKIEEDRAEIVAGIRHSRLPAPLSQERNSAAFHASVWWQSAIKATLTRSVCRVK